jgi:hypothetical protein
VHQPVTRKAMLVQVAQRQRELERELPPQRTLDRPSLNNAWESAGSVGRLTTTHGKARARSGVSQQRMGKRGLGRTSLNNTWEMGQAAGSRPRGETLCERAGDQRLSAARRARVEEPSASGGGGSASCSVPLRNRHVRRHGVSRVLSSSAVRAASMPRARSCSAVQSRGVWAVGWHGRGGYGYGWWGGMGVVCGWWGGMGVVCGWWGGMGVVHG